MAKNRVPTIPPKPEFLREDTTEPEWHGEVPKKSPIAPPEFIREGSPTPQAAENNNVPSVNPNPPSEFLLEGITPPVPLADENEVDD